MFIKCIFLAIFIGLMDAAGLTCPQPHLDNGSWKIRQRSRGLVRFTCLPRYKLVGNRYATCRNGHWDAPLPVCTRTGCTVPSIENGISVPSSDETWIMYFCSSGYKLVGSSIIYCDGKAWNASAPSCVKSSESHKLSCDFEDPDLCGWTHDELHDFDWSRLNKKTPSSFLFTGPSFDHTYGEEGSGHYMYIESTSRRENDTARLLSPLYDSSLAKNGCFSFFYHMYGKTCGGLRVYQKPDKLTLQNLLNMPENERKNYTLFEKWGNLGNFWYSSVTTLSDFSDEFQIVIEGIRGSSFTSDIAIDDVSIKQGENCTIAKNAMISPTTVVPDSCAGRCSKTLEPRSSSWVSDLRCGCTASCLIEEDCCLDYFDACIFLPDYLPSSDDLVPETSTDVVPQTQKLVATTSETTPPTTKQTTSMRTTTTTTATSSKPTTTTIKPTTSTRKSTTTTAARTTTKRVSTRIPTIKTKVSTMSAPLHSTARTRPPTTSQKPTYITTKTEKIKTTTRGTKQANVATRASHGLLNKTEIHRELEEKSKKEKFVERRKIIEITHTVAQRSDSSWSIVLLAIGLVVCVSGGAWIVRVTRSERGRVVIARLRGRINNDPEVRYLSTDVDDD